MLAVLGALHPDFRRKLDVELAVGDGGLQAGGNGGGEFFRSHPSSITARAAPAVLCDGWGSRYGIRAFASIHRACGTEYRSAELFPG
jgi:hypothetical protein